MLLGVSPRRLVTAAALLGALAAVLAACSSDTPTAVPTATPTAALTATPTVVPTATPTAVPTAAPTAVPTATPTAVPTAAPTAVPTATPPAAPTVTPTAMPTATPTPTPPPLPRPQRRPYFEVWIYLSNSYWLDTQVQDAAAAIQALPWVADGIDDAERQAVQQLIDLGVQSSEVCKTSVGQPWVADGLDESEREVLTRLGEIATKDEAAALRILEMPFLDTVAAVDAGAMRALWHLASKYRERFQQALAHPTLREGITDEWAKVVVVLGVVRDDTPDLLDTLLDPDQVNVEERTINLPLAGEVDLAIVRTRPGSEHSMDMLERCVRGVEDFMGVPLPVGYVTVLFEDNISVSGFNAQTYIAALTRHDVGGSAIGILSHEVGHYYWRGNHAWVDEGAATFISRTLREDSPARWAEPYGFPFRFAANLADLESRLALGSDRGYLSLSNRQLGDRIFTDFYRTLGDDTFRAGFRNLYLMSDDVKVGISQLKAAVKAAAPEAAATIDSIAARWYDGSEPYDTSFLDTAPVDTSLPIIDGRLDRAYIALSQDGPPVARFSTHEVTGNVWLSLEYSYHGDPRPLRLEIVEYFEDAFAFRRREVTVDPPAERSSQRYQVPVVLESVPGTEASVRSEWWTEYVPHGRYWVYVYPEGRKVAEVEYEVTE